MPESITTLLFFGFLAGLFGDAVICARVDNYNNSLRETTVTSAVAKGAKPGTDVYVQGKMFLGGIQEVERITAINLTPVKGLQTGQPMLRQDIVCNEYSVDYTGGVAITGAPVLIRDGSGSARPVTNTFTSVRPVSSAAVAGAKPGAPGPA